MMTWRDIDGWFDFSAIYDAVAQDCTNDDVLVEVGCWLGKSVNYLASACKELGKRPRIIAVDTFCCDLPEYRDELARQGGSVAGEFLRNLQACGNDDIVGMRIMPSVEAAAMFADKSLRLVFIDAGHDYESVRQDIKAWHDKVKPGGFFAGHDYPCVGVANAVDELLPQAVALPPRSWIDQAILNQK